MVKTSYLLISLHNTISITIKYSVVVVIQKNKFIFCCKQNISNQLNNNYKKLKKNQIILCAQVVN